MMTLTTAALLSSHLFALQFAAGSGDGDPPPFSEVFASVPRGGEIDLPRNTRLFIAEGAAYSMYGIAVEVDDGAVEELSDWREAFSIGADLGQSEAGDLTVHINGLDDESVALAFSLGGDDDTENPVPGAAPRIQSVHRISDDCGLGCQFEYAEVLVQIPPATDDTIIAQYEVKLQGARDDRPSKWRVLAPVSNTPFDFYFIVYLEDDADADFVVDVDVLVHDVAGNVSAYESVPVTIPASALVPNLVPFACACQRRSGTPAMFFGLAFGGLIFGMRRRRGSSVTSRGEPRQRR